MKRHYYMLVIMLFGKENCIINLLSDEIVMLTFKMCCLQPLSKQSSLTLNNCFHKHLLKLSDIVYSVVFRGKCIIFVYNIRSMTALSCGEASSSLAVSV